MYKTQRNQRIPIEKEKKKKNNGTQRKTTREEKTDKRSEDRQKTITKWQYQVILASTYFKYKLHNQNNITSELIYKIISNYMLFTRHSL